MDEESLGDQKIPNSEFWLLENKDWSGRLLKNILKERHLKILFSEYGLHLYTLTIQTSLAIAQIALLIFYAIKSLSYNAVADILGCLGVEVILWLVTSIVFRRVLGTQNWLPNMASSLAILSAIFVDTVLPVYQTASLDAGSDLRPVYIAHALVASHIFLPQDNNITSVIFEVKTSASHFAHLDLVTRGNSINFLEQVLADAIFFLCINVLGIYCRYINEILIRRTFLDKRACVESTLKLNYEKEREEKLMLSILPRHLASRIGENLRKKLISSRNGERIPDNPCLELYVERHNDVSILYADVVNYTKITALLPANRLVEILNELFGRFDKASEKHKVLRIKVLGDCYYCVSGLPQPNPDHAKSCVELALEMIDIIKNMRKTNDLNIDMRIGIHSGSILCGILGKSKWQYDIWSKDVIIANHMEQSGRSGMVHVTKQTLDRLGSNYRVEPGFGSLRDGFLAKCNIETFFVSHENQISIIPRDRLQAILSLPMAQSEEKIKRKPFEYNYSCNRAQKYAIDMMCSMNRVMGEGGPLVQFRKQGDFTGSNAIMHKEQLNMADTHMTETVEKVAVGKFNQWFRKETVGFLSLNFHGIKEWEKPFLQKPVRLFKCYVSSALFGHYCCVVFVKCLIFSRCSLVSTVVYGITAFILASFLPLTLTHFIGSKVRKEEDPSATQPTNFILQKLYDLSLKVICSSLMGTMLYVTICSILSGCLLTKLVNEGMQTEDCDSDEYGTNYTKLFSGSRIDTLLGPWQMTDGWVLAITMCFIFFRIHRQLKVIIVSLISAVYIYYIYNHKSVVLEIIAHILSILFIVLKLHLVDQQTEFMSRSGSCWKNQLVEKKDGVESIKSINKRLLQNILPIHVAEIYLDVNRSSNKLYHEDYECVSVMFASLTNYSLYNEADTNVEAMECQRLHILNLIICSFDDALLGKEFKRIEKIKVAGWSYMAACGLAPGSRNSKNVRENRDNKVLLIIARFAAEMMRILKKINAKYSTDFGLRVGISHGPVTAGVVGYHKPYYDIWGNTVNVASRMDSTGETGKIQIPEESAAILQAEGVECRWRGNIFIKGKGHMHTFYVQLTKDCYLQEA